MDDPRRGKKLHSLKVVSILTTGAVLLVFLGLIVGISTFSTLNMLNKHERENIRQQGNTAASTVAAANENLQAVTRDWSSWDETYAFALGENDAEALKLFSRSPGKYDIIKFLDNLQKLSENRVSHDFL